MTHGGLVNIVDVEATCWDGERPPGAVSEIIEIGLTVVDLAAGERLSRHRILVRPARSRVSAFCTELTGLTQAEVDTGLDFAAACRLLATTYEAGARPWASWGDYDRKQFALQCRATGTPYPFGTVTPTPRRCSRRRSGCAGVRAWRRPWRSPGFRWKDVITGARTTPGTSPPWCCWWPGATRGRSTGRRPRRVPGRGPLRRSPRKLRLPLRRTRGGTMGRMPSAERRRQLVEAAIRAMTRDGSPGPPRGRSAPRPVCR